MMGWVEFSNEVTFTIDVGEAIPGAPPIEVNAFNGTQFFLGPVVGLHFGQ